MSKVNSKQKKKHQPQKSNNTPRKKVERIKQINDNVSQEVKVFSDVKEEHHQPIKQTKRVKSTHSLENEFIPRNNNNFTPRTDFPKQKDNSKFPRKLTPKQIIKLISLIVLGITHIAIVLAIVLSFRYYSIYPSLFGNIVGVVICFQMIIDIIFVIGFNHHDFALTIVSSILSIFMLIGGSVGSYYVAKANSIIDSVLDSSSSKYETYSGTFVCYNKYNEFTSLNDLEGRKVGFLTESSNGITYIAQDILNDTKIDYATIYYKTNAELIQALIDDEVNAIAITTAYRDIYSLERDENSPFAIYLDNLVDFVPFERELKINSNKKAKNISTDPFNVLLIGYSRTDIGSSVGLADSIILATINPQSYEVSMMSIARDSFVPISCYGGAYDKINSGRSTSRQCFIDTVSNFLNMDIDYYMELDYLGLVDIVNTIGGIKINNPVEFELDGIYVPAGEYVADGQQVLQFCRERHHMPNGDFDRQQHQKEAIIAIARKFIEAGDVNLALTAMKEASQWMSTDLTLTQLTTVFNLLLNTKNFTSLDTFDLVDFQTLRMTGYGGMNYYSYSMHLPLWVYLIYQGSYDESMQHINEVMGNYDIINQKRGFEFSLNEKYVRPELYSLSYPNVFMFTPEPMPAFWASFNGMSFEEAAAWANSHGVVVTVGSTITPADPGYDASLEGRIVDQSVRYGSLIADYKSCEVTIMGGGDINTDDFYVPNFIGKDISSVIEWANAHNITVSGNDGISSGRVVTSQDPSAGTAIKDVDRIRVTLKQPETYTITFNPNGGTVDITSKTIAEGQTYGVLPTPSLTGKAFVGWYTSLNGGTKVTSETLVTGNAILYAHWADIVTITLNPNGGSVSPTTITATDALPTPTYEGHDFKGWWTQETGGVEITDASTIVVDKTLYAHWQVHVHTHDYSIDIPAVDPTCINEGSTAGKKCSCGEIDPSHTPTTIPALGHDPQHVDAIHSDPDHDCMDSGREEGEICSRCGAIISGCEEITPLGHFFVDNGDGTETCNVCGFTEPIPPEG